MAVRDVSAEVMVTLSAAWLDPERQRPLLQSIPLVAALLPRLDEAHRGLLETQLRQSSAPLEAARGAIQDKQVSTDGLHDRKMRGSFGLLTALADLTDDPAKARRYEELRDNLCPIGLKGTTASYVAQAGAARMLPSRLTAEDQALVDSIPLPEGRLRDAVDTWTNAALELEKLEAQKVELDKQLKDAPTVRPIDVRQARYRWIRAARALEVNLDLAEVDDATSQTLLASLHAAARKAERRKPAPGAPPDVEPAVDDEPPVNDDV
jgi:hypothetical protein